MEQEEIDRQNAEDFAADPSVIDGLDEEQFSKFEASVERHKARMSGVQAQVPEQPVSASEPAMDIPSPVVGNVAEGPRVNPSGVASVARSFIGGAYPYVGQKIAGLEADEPQSVVDAAYREAAGEHPWVHAAGAMASPITKIVGPVQAALGGSKAAGTLAGGAVGALYGGAEAAGMGRDPGIEAGIGGAAGVLVPPVVQAAVVNPLAKAKDYLVARFGQGAADWARSAAERVLTSKTSGVDPKAVAELNAPGPYGKKIDEMAEYLLKHIGLNPFQTAASRASRSADLISEARAQHSSNLDDLISKEVPVDKLSADVAASAKAMREASPGANTDIDFPESQVRESLFSGAKEVIPEPGTISPKTVDLRKLHDSITNLQSGQYANAKGLSRPVGEREAEVMIGLNRDALKANISRETAASYDEAMFKHSAAERVHQSLSSQASRPYDMGGGFATTPSGAAAAGGLSIAKRSLDSAIGGAAKVAFSSARRSLLDKILKSGATPPTFSPNINPNTKSEFDRALAAAADVATDEEFATRAYALVSSNPDLAGYIAGLLNEKD